jgi:broad specificity phosphatase PhoE
MMKNNMTIFYIVRHGETDWNKKRIVQGQTETLLTELGLKQAEEVAKLLKKIQFDFAFSSDLFRSKKTTEIIALEHNLEVQSSKLLREKRMGKLQGQPSHVLIAHTELANALNMEERKKHRVASDAESDQEVIDRVFTFIRETALAYPGKKILVGTHGGVMRLILIELGIMAYNEFYDKRFINGGYIKLISDGVEFFVDETHGFEARQKGASDL